MQLENLISFIEQFLSLKRKYPIIFHYHKFLKLLLDGSKEAQEAEINCFTLWLGTNPQIPKKVLDNPKYTSTSKGKVLFFDVILKLLDDGAKKNFWVSIQALCKTTVTEKSVTSVFNKIQHNKFVKEILVDLELDETLNTVDIDKLDMDDIDKLLFSNQFLPTVNKLKQGITSGKYDYKNFMPLIKETFTDLQTIDCIDGGSKKTLAVLDKELTRFSKGNEPNLDRVLGALKEDPLIAQTSFNSVLNTL